MNRLTKRLENGVVNRTDVDDNNRGDSVMLRLATYEDTGLEPAEIRQMKEELERLRAAQCETCVHRNTESYRYYTYPCKECKHRARDSYESNSSLPEGR